MHLTCPKITFLNHASTWAVSLFLYLTHIYLPYNIYVLFLSIPCLLNGLSREGANKCIVDFCDMLNISVWVVKARAHADLSSQ